VPLIAQGGPHPRRDACRAALALAVGREVDFRASVELVQEFVFHRLRKTGDPVLAVAQGEALRALVGLAPFDETVLDAAQELIRAGHARGRDAVHAATALRAGIATIVTTDLDFAQIPGLTALAPEALVAAHPGPAQPGAPNLS
jgi:predicted nucleic acid-binding protein